MLIIWCVANASAGLLHRCGRPLHSIALFETVATKNLPEVLLAELGLLKVKHLGLRVSISTI